MPTYVVEMSTNESGQIILEQKSLFSFFHAGVPFTVQLARNYHKGMNVGVTNGYLVRLTAFLGFLPTSLQGGAETRNKVLSLIYRSNYQEGIDFYVNHRQMIIMVCHKQIAADEALNVAKIMACVVDSYQETFPFIELFGQYIKRPGKMSKRYEMQH